MSDGTVAPVDLTGWYSGDERDRDGVAAAVDAACSGSGFLSVTGHGIPQALMADMLDTSAAFFDLPAPVKLGYRPDDLELNRGYVPEGTEALSYSLGVESPPDLYEAFIVGREVPPDGESDEALRTYFAPNLWPTEMPRLREVALSWWDACEELGFTLVDIFARALDLPHGWFRPFLDRSISVMRANNYQRRGASPVPVEGQLRMGAHSDYGCATILLADRVPGLQVADTAGGWHDVLPAPGALLVNLGDLLAEWTNDRWRSTLHRVVPAPADVEGDFRRRSVAWFQQPNHDARIEVIPSCQSEANPPRYRPTTSGEHMLAKLAGPRDRLAVDARARVLR